LARSEAGRRFLAGAGGGVPKTGETFRQPELGALLREVAAHGAQAMVRSPNAYFGKLATQDKGAADLRLNLARILKAKGEVPPPPPVEETAAELLFAPGVEDHPWPEIAGICGRLSAKGPGAAGSAESASMASSTGS
jgi:hypothetical protein